MNQIDPKKAQTLRCGISGAEMLTPFCPGGIHAEFIHPLFTVPAKHLWRFAPMEKRMEWSQQENALFFLALLSKSDYVHFLPAKGKISELDATIIFNESERILSFLKRATALPTGFDLPRIILQVGGAAENSLSRIPDFLYILHDEIDKYHEGYVTATARKESSERLVRLERFIRRNAKGTKNKKALGKILSEWAAISAEFSEFTQAQETPYGTLSLTNYWKHIIQLCVSGEEKLWQIPGEDFAELIEHCEENLNHGTFYAAELMRSLRDGAVVARDSFGLSNPTGFDFLANLQSEKEKTVFQILEDFIAENPSAPRTPKLNEAEIVRGFISSMVISAPAEEPKPSAFPSKIEYLRAKGRWEMAQAELKKKTECEGNQND